MITATKKMYVGATAVVNLLQDEIQTRINHFPRILITPSISLVGLVEETARFRRWAALRLGGDPILGEASGSRRISVAYLVSSLALAGSAYRGQ